LAGSHNVPGDYFQVAKSAATGEVSILKIFELKVTGSTVLKTLDKTVKPNALLKDVPENVPVQVQISVHKPNGVAASILHYYKENPPKGGIPSDRAAMVEKYFTEQLRSHNAKFPVTMDVYQKPSINDITGMRKHLESNDIHSVKLH